MTEAQAFIEAKAETYIWIMFFVIGLCLATLIHHYAMPKIKETALWKRLNREK